MDATSNTLQKSIELKHSIFLISLAIAAVAANILEERDISQAFVANIKSNHDWMFSKNDVKSVYSGVTPPCSMRASSLLIITCIASPSIHGLTRYLQTSLFTIFACIIVIIAAFRANITTRISQCIFAVVTLWTVSISMIVKKDIVSLRHLIDSIVLYLGLVCIRSAFDSCTSVIYDPIFAGCQSCDVFMSLLISGIGSVAASKSFIFISSFGIYDNRRYRMTCICTGICSIFYIVSMIWVARIIAHNPSYLPARLECKLTPDLCNNDPNDDPYGRRNSIVNYAPGTIGLLVLIHYVDAFDVAL